MDGLLLSGGADVDPARYGRRVSGAEATEPERDALEAEAWAVATARAVPILGICRGFQAINVFAGGTLLQHVDGHAGAGFGHGPAATHPLRPAPGSRLTRILFPTNARGGVLTVNSYHHQGVLATDLAPSLVASAWASSPSGDLVEGLEAADGRFVVGVQCHPERTESTPAAFARLFSVFVDAARGPASRRYGRRGGQRPARSIRNGGVHSTELMPRKPRIVRRDQQRREETDDQQVHPVVGQLPEPGRRAGPEAPKVHRVDRVLGTGDRVDDRRARRPERSRRSRAIGPPLAPPSSR